MKAASSSFICGRVRRPAVLSSYTASVPVAPDQQRSPLLRATDGKCSATLASGDVASGWRARARATCRRYKCGISKLRTLFSLGKTPNKTVNRQLCIRLFEHAMAGSDPPRFVPWSEAYSLDLDRWVARAPRTGCSALLRATVALESLHEACGRSSARAGAGATWRERGWRSVWERRQPPERGLAHSLSS